MPNYATSFVTIIGEPEQIDALITDAITPGRDTVAATLDFDKVVPMPAELRDTIAPVKVVDTDAEAAELNAALLAESERNPDVHQGKTIRAITKAQAAGRAATYGTMPGLGPVLTWYEWAVKNWGTKWDVTSASTYQRTEPGRLNLTFTTAWAMPTPIFRALETQYGVRVHARAMIEGGFDDETYGDPEEYIEEQRTLNFY